MRRLDQTRNQTIRRLLFILRYLSRHKLAGEREICDAAGISRSTLYRVLAAGERDLGVVIRGDHGAGGYTIESWGVLSRAKVLAANAQAHLPPEQPQAAEGTLTAPAVKAVRCSASLGTTSWRNTVDELMHLDEAAYANEPAEHELTAMRAALRQASFCLRELLPNDADAQMTVRMINRSLSRYACPECGCEALDSRGIFTCECPARPNYNSTP